MLEKGAEEGPIDFRGPYRFQTGVPFGPVPIVRD